MTESEIITLALCRLESLREKARLFISGKSYTVSEIRCQADSLEKYEKQYEELLLKLKGIE